MLDSEGLECGEPRLANMDAQVSLRSAKFTVVGCVTSTAAESVRFTARAVKVHSSRSGALWLHMTVLQ